IVAVVVCVPDAAVPVIVKPTPATGVAPPAAVSVSVAPEPACTDGGEKLPVTPEGSPLTDSAMLWAAPDVTAVETVNVVCEPAWTVCAGGVTPTMKSLSGGTACTSSETFALWLFECAVPLTTTSAEPTAAFRLAVTVMRDVPPALTDGGAKATVTPLGSPLAPTTIDSAPPEASARRTLKGGDRPTRTPRHPRA